MSYPRTPTHTAAALAAASGYPPQPGMPSATDGRGVPMGMGPPRGPPGMMGSMGYYSPHDPSMMGLMPVRACVRACVRVCMAGRLAGWLAGWLWERLWFFLPLCK